MRVALLAAACLLLGLAALGELEAKQEEEDEDEDAPAELVDPSTIKRRTTDCGFTVPAELAERYPLALPRIDENGWFCRAQMTFKKERDQARVLRKQWLKQQAKLFRPDDIVSIRSVGDKEEDTPTSFEGPGFGMALYGDSVVQCLKYQFPSCMGAPRVLKRRLGKYKPAVWGLGNDRSTSLLWRLLQGVDPSGTGVQASVVLAPMNDYSKWSGTEFEVDPEAPAVQQMGQSMVDVAEYLGGIPGNHALVVGLLPRDKFWPGWYTPHYETINTIMELGIGELRANQSMTNVHYLDCSDLVLEPVKGDPGNFSIPVDLIQDGIHLTAKGWDVVLSECIMPVLEEIFGF